MKWKPSEFSGPLSHVNVCDYRINTEESLDIFGIDPIQPGDIFPELPPGKSPGDFLKPDGKYDIEALYLCSAHWKIQKVSCLYDPPLSEEDVNFLSGPEANW